MSPRRYSTQKRAEGFAATRRAIVEAAKSLHAERGVQATSWQDIAERAAISPVTVYRHFRSLTELIPACAQSFVESVAPISEDEARAAFAELASSSQRLERLIKPLNAPLGTGKRALFLQARTRRQNNVGVLARLAEKNVLNHKKVEALKPRPDVMSI